MLLRQPRTGLALLAALVMAFSVLGGTVALLGATAAPDEGQPYRLA